MAPLTTRARATPLNLRPALSAHLPACASSEQLSPLLMKQLLLASQEEQLFLAEINYCLLEHLAPHLAPVSHNLCPVTSYPIPFPGKKRNDIEGHQNCTALCKHCLSLPATVDAD